jgi:hypothetical protein
MIIKQKKIRYYSWERDFAKEILYLLDDFTWLKGLPLNYNIW